MTNRPAPIGYNVDYSAAQKFIHHLKFLLPLHIARTIKGEGTFVPPNWFETLGNKGISWVPSIPHAYEWLDQTLYDPRVLLVAFSALSLISIQFMFYPVSTLKAAVNIQNFIIKSIPGYEVIKFWSYVAWIEISFSLSLRAAGRLFNETLRRNFYTNNLI